MGGEHAGRGERGEEGRERGKGAEKKGKANKERGEEHGREMRERHISVYTYTGASAQKVSQTKSTSLMKTQPTVPAT